MTYVIMQISSCITPYTTFLCRVQTISPELCYFYREYRLNYTPCVILTGSLCLSLCALTEHHTMK
jgi:hypothetical protein